MLKVTSVSDVFSVESEQIIVFFSLNADFVGNQFIFYC